MYSWVLASPGLLSRACKHHVASRSDAGRFTNRAKSRRPMRPAMKDCTEAHSKTDSSSLLATRTESLPRTVKILPLEVVQRIAAGEVITGYDSVVQELVENSIDANASMINVNIDFFTCSVTVHDDGVGISPEHGLAEIAKCNATSKLRNLSQLDAGIRTLGFRGQGLWAIAMTAEKLEACSRTNASLCGMQVSFTSDGTLRKDYPVPAAMAEGTIVNVTGLPWSTEPGSARRMMKQCKDWLVRTALCYPTVKFHLTRSGKSAWRATASGKDEGDARIRLLANELKLHPNDFRTASMSIPDAYSVSVVIGTPSVAYSSSKSWVVTAINGRCVSIPSIRRAIIRALNVRNRRYPVAFVNIITKPRLVDWNILPKKTRIRFNSVTAEKKLVETVTSLVRDAMQGKIVSEFARPDSLGDESFPVSGEIQGGMRGIVSLLSERTSRSKIRDSDDTTSRGGTDSDTADGSLPRMLLQARVVAQVLNTYILIEHKAGIILAEQHVADERVIYEGLLRNWKASRFVALKEPLRLPDGMRTEWIFTLTTLGLISCDEDDNHVEEAYEVTAVPEVMASIPRSNLLVLLLEICREGSTIEEAAAAVACRLAVKNGMSLKMREMEGIVRRLMVCNNSFTCPHGRPILIELHTTELASLFGRSWTPERTNGIGNDKPKRMPQRGVLAE